MAGLGKDIAALHAGFPTLRFMRAIQRDSPPHRKNSAPRRPPSTKPKPAGSNSNSSARGWRGRSTHRPPANRASSFHLRASAAKEKKGHFEYNYYLENPG